MALPKRVLVVAPATILIATSVGVGPAAAAASGQADCVGAYASTYNELGKYFGLSGYGGRYVIAPAASTEGGIGDFASGSNPGHC